MAKLIIYLFVMLIMFIVANNKGFNPWLWLLAAGIPGFIILLCMPSANASNIDDETRARRRRSGNSVGSVISVIAVVLIVVFFAWLSSL